MILRYACFLRKGLGAHGFKVFEAELGRQGIVEASIRKPESHHPGSGLARHGGCSRDQGDTRMVGYADYYFVRT